VAPHVPTRIILLDIASNFMIPLCAVNNAFRPKIRSISRLAHMYLTWPGSPWVMQRAFLRMHASFVQACLQVAEGRWGVAGGQLGEATRAEG